MSERTIIKTVAELIEVLQQYPPDSELEVTYDSGYGAWFIVEQFELEGTILHIEVET
jgi:hypothetical protein